jgi:uncharacterized damage-inducible protein DinB
MIVISRIIVLAVLLSVGVPAPAQKSAVVRKSIPDSLDYMWKQIEMDFTSLAEAMPDAKWNFKPSQGEFTDVRTFAEQVKHVACSNEGWAKQINGDESIPRHCETGGPNPAKTKAEIVDYLKRSFQLLEAEITATNADNLLQPAVGPYAGSNRLEAVSAALWHTTDHYGQLVLYLRMNGIIPPASR